MDNETIETIETIDDLRQKNELLQEMLEGRDARLRLMHDALLSALEDLNAFNGKTMSLNPKVGYPCMMNSIPLVQEAIASGASHERK